MPGRISELTAATIVNDPDLVEIAQAGVSKKATAELIRAGFNPATSAAQVTYAPTGDITETNTQAAVAGVDSRLIALRTRVTALEAGGTEGQSLTTGINAGSITPSTMLTYTIPANVMGVGDTAIFVQQGDGYTNDVALPSPQFLARHNTVTFADSIGVTITEAQNTTRFVWTLILTVTPRTTTTADIVFQLFRTGLAAAAKMRTFSAGKSLVWSNPVDTPQTINLTVANTFDVQVQWSAASATSDLRWGPSNFSLVKAPA